MGFEPIAVELQVAGSHEQHFELEDKTLTLSEVSVERTGRGTDAEARRMEKNAQNVLNVISAKQIQLSPDISVANVIQRVSGLSIERNANGDPQYAIVRGMDKRYNNTLVNGIKIPSPDNENRFIPLDIFPAIFLDRLEVYKSLTADMEADAIGGTVNMEMKDAPLVGHILDLDVQVGYNQMNFDRDFTTYDRSRLNKRSPAELFGADYHAVPGDFPVENMIEKPVAALPDIIANGTYGQRFLDNRLGLMVGASFQNTNRPTDNYVYRPGIFPVEGNPIRLEQLDSRYANAQQQRLGAHGRLTYDVNAKNKFSLYAGQYMLNEFRVRETVLRENFAAATNAPVYPSTRFTNSFQTISTVDLNGDHQFGDRLMFDWNAVYSHALNDRPDDGTYHRSATLSVEDGSISNERIYFQNSPHTRIWERNSDQTASAYLNLSFNPDWVNEHTRIKVGGVSHFRWRDNYYNYYSYVRVIPSVIGVRGEGWNDFGDIPYEDMATPFGSGGGSNLIYDASERILAAYINTSWRFGQSQVEVGVRAEHTDQRFDIDPRAFPSNPGAEFEPSASQAYLNLFPAFSFKQLLNAHTNLRATYFRGISRPGFYEIVPTIRPSDGSESYFSERGNPDLKPSLADNFDIRYEYFPTVLDQILVGVFFKRIQDPIEYGFPQIDPNLPENERESAGRASRIMPQNFGTARNFGIELDITKYFNQFGIRANYTYTHSRLVTNKLVANTNDQIAQGAPSFSIVDQFRALQGQSPHIANLSLLYKNQPAKLDAQLVINYTGERIALVSPFFEADQRMRAMTIMDLSVEKGVGNHLVFFVKANNLLNTPYALFVDKPVYQAELGHPHQRDPAQHTNIQRDTYGQLYRLGVRYRL